MDFCPFIIHFIPFHFIVVVLFFSLLSFLVSVPFFIRLFSFHIIFFHHWVLLLRPINSILTFNYKLSSSVFQSGLRTVCIKDLTIIHFFFVLFFGRFYHRPFRNFPKLEMECSHWHSMRYTEYHYWRTRQPYYAILNCYLIHTTYYCLHLFHAKTLRYAVPRSRMNESFSSQLVICWQLFSFFVPLLIRFHLCIWVFACSLFVVSVTSSVSTFKFVYLLPGIVESNIWSRKFCQIYKLQIH